ncbi:hypothetical protein CMEL01_12602 [Colletotrichum melonis]|uniref:Dihydrodipicolinate synthase n=1 Tax=Colletotrichum melonis TaxID=1209925 RepID=A0AAI9XU33_9PEZI|nr:hypothetical protein CMEL01_12602 [Colletotrichum melonis]
MGLILNPGAYGPLPTFFNEKQEIDYGSYEKHLLNLARRGINPVCAGSLGEAVHLSPEERVDLIKFIRRTLDDAGLTDMPIVAGVGGSSTRETVKLAHAAGNAGADAGLVILPAYYAASLSTDQNQIIQYYVDICKESPIPLFLYNFPANAGGLDMSSAVIEAVIRQAPNLCGVKLTGGHGTVSGIPNFAPAASMRLWALLIKPNLTEDERQEADRIQSILSNADVAAVPAGVRGMITWIWDRPQKALVETGRN